MLLCYIQVQLKYHSFWYALSVDKSVQLLECTELETICILFF